MFLEVGQPVFYQAEGVPSGSLWVNGLVSKGEEEGDRAKQPIEWWDTVFLGTGVDAPLYGQEARPICNVDL